MAKKSVNIIGGCVSRDMLQAGVDAEKYEMKQFLSFISPVSLFSDPCEKIPDIGVLPWGSNFDKRNLLFDLTKTGLEYVFSERSDYLIVDIVDCRFDLLCHGDISISVSNAVKYNEKQLNDFFGDGFWELKSYDSFGEEVHILAVMRLAEEILKHYRPENIIINRYFAADKIYSCKNGLQELKDEDKIKFRTSGYLSEKLYDVLEDKFKGCHVINFPDNVLADEFHKWGLYPFHYVSLYYEYGQKAIDIIVEGSRNEKAELEALRLDYSMAFLDYQVESEGSKKGFKGLDTTRSGKMMFTQNGHWDDTFTGVGMLREDGRWLFVRKGRFDAGYTGVAETTNGNWVFVRNGCFDKSFTGGAVTINGNYVFVRNGRWDTTFTGIADLIDSETKIYIKDGRLEKEYTGTFGGYDIKNGIVIK